MQRKIRVKVLRDFSSPCYGAVDPVSMPEINVKEEHLANLKSMGYVKEKLDKKAERKNK